MITILVFIIVLSVLIFVHEFGHFIVAKRAGMKVEEFVRLQKFRQLARCNRVEWALTEHRCDS